MFKLSNLGNYFKRLIPTFKRTDISIDAQHAFAEIHGTIEPMYSISGVAGFVGKTLDNTEFELKKDIHGYHESAYETIKKVVQMIQDNEDHVIALIKQEFTEENLKITSDYYRLNIIKYIEGITLISDYAKAWLTAVACETVLSKHLKDGYSPEVFFSPTIKCDIEYVNELENIMAFAAAVNMHMQPLTHFLNSIKDLKGHTFNEQDWESSHPTMTDKLDPYKACTAFVTWNPWYICGLAMNGWRAERHEKNKAELIRIQLILKALQADAIATEDPNKVQSLEKQIAYYSNLINKISAKIEDMEEKAHDNV